MICITGQAPTDELHQEAFQAVDIVEIAKPVTKWAVQVKETAQLPWVFREAFRIAREGRPGPGADRPAARRAEAAPRSSRTRTRTRRCPIDRADAAPGRDPRAVDMLLQAERPMILAGGGVILAEAAPELLRAGRVPADPGHADAHGQGRDPRGPPALRRRRRHPDEPALRQRAVPRERLRPRRRRALRRPPHRRPRRLPRRAHVRPGRHRALPDRPRLPARPRDRLRRRPRARRDARGRPRHDPAARRRARGRERVAELRSTLLRKTDFDDVPVKPQRVYQEVNEVFDEDTVFLTAIGLYQIFSGQFQKTYKPRHYICCGQAGPLGWEVPACIGAQARRAREARSSGSSATTPSSSSWRRSRWPCSTACRSCS